jgi:hypothetical protein
MTQHSSAVPSGAPGYKGGASNQTAAEKLSLFQKIADRVSYGMGTPQNITIWIILVGTWVALGPLVSHHNFLPAWFTSNSFNFPLNSVTTVLELYIGFLVGASSNRSERNLELTLAGIASGERQIREVEDGVRADLASNTKLTQEVHKLATTIAAQTATMEEFQRYVTALVSQAASSVPPMSQHTTAPAGPDQAPGQ